MFIAGERKRQILRVKFLKSRSVIAAFGLVIVVLISSEIYAATPRATALPQATRQSWAACEVDSPLVELRAQLSADARFAKKANEISGIALAGFLDKEGQPVLWAHEENKPNLLLLSTHRNHSLVIGNPSLHGRKPRDAEDIAVVPITNTPEFHAPESHASGIIYLADTGSNIKSLHACARFERQVNGAQCSVVSGEIETIGVERITGNILPSKLARQGCLSKGADRFWIDELPDTSSAYRPAIWRIAEPKSMESALRHGLSPPDIINFEYPKQCGNRACGEMAMPGMEALHARYNVEALMIIKEPDNSHTAYLFSKSHKSYAALLRKQRRTLAACEFESDGRADVFRLENIDRLRPQDRHMASYVTTLYLTPQGSLHTSEVGRLTAASYFAYEDDAGIMVLKTNSYGYRWPVATTDIIRNAKGAPRYDIQSILDKRSPCPVATAQEKIKGNKATVENRLAAEAQLEAFAQVGNGGAFQIGECAGFPKCRLYYTRERYRYLPGDVNGNGTVEATDAELLEAYLAGQRSLFCVAAADVQADGVVDAADLKLLQDYLLNKKGILAQVIGNGLRSAGTGVLGCDFYSGQL
jgi:hypothetical protein